MIAQLEAGALDTVTHSAAVATSSACRRTRSIRASPTPTGAAGTWSAYNTTVPPFDNKLVRQAMNYAIDRQRFVDTVLLGRWHGPGPAVGAGLARVRSQTRTARYTFDLDQARSLLAQAGVSSITADIVPLPELARESRIRPDVPGRPGQNRCRR